MTWLAQGLAVATIIVGSLLGFVLGVAYIVGDEEARECLVTSHSISEQAVEGSWVYDSRTLYEGDCVIAGHSS